MTAPENPSASNSLLWEFVATTLLDDAKAYRLSQLCLQNLDAFDGLLIDESERSFRRRLEGLEGYAQLFAQNSATPSSTQESKVIFERAKAIPRVNKRGKVRLEIIHLQESASIQGPFPPVEKPRRLPIWSLRVLPVCFPIAETPNADGAGLASAAWGAKFLGIAAELRTGVVLFEVTETRIFQNFRHIEMGAPEFAAETQSNRFPRVKSSLQAWGGAVHLSSDKSPLSKQLENTCQSWFGASDPVARRKVINLSMPPLFPSEDEGLLVLNADVPKDKLQRIEGAWNAVAEEKAPISEFRDLIWRSMPRSGRVSKSILLGGCYQKLLPFVGNLWRNGNRFYSDSHADFRQKIRTGYFHSLRPTVMPKGKLHKGSQRKTIPAVESEGSN